MRRDRMWELVAGGWVLFAMATGVEAQTPVRAPAGSVSGHVLCADTQRPARFAEVILVPRPKEKTAEAVAEGPPKGTRSAPRFLIADGRTGLDGSYTISNVPPGEYFVMGRLAGYIPPVGDVEAEEDYDNLDKLLAGAPIVHVIADHVSSASLIMHRGGVIGGTVRFDDGTPLAGRSIEAERVGATDHVDVLHQWDYHGLDSYPVTTDDLGRYRLPGLRPGKYRVQLNLNIAGGSYLTAWEHNGITELGQSGSSSVGMNMSVYAPGTLRRSQGKVIEIKGDEQYSDVDISVGLDGLHSVSGRVAAKNQGQFNGGIVSVSDMKDKGFYRTTDLAADGTYRIEYVPSGAYMLVINGILMDGSRRFKRVELPVMMVDGDVMVDDISLEDLSPAKP